MTTRGYIRYVRADGPTRRAAAKISHDAGPGQVGDRIAELRRGEEFNTPHGYAAAHVLADPAALHELDRRLLDPAAPVPGNFTWAYEVIIDGPFLSEWQVRVARDFVPENDEWPLDGPASTILPLLRELRTQRDVTTAFRGLVGAYDDPDHSVGEFVTEAGGGQR